METKPFDAAKYLTDNEAQIAALIDAYASGHAGVIDRTLEHVLRTRDPNNEKEHGTNA